MVPILPCLRPVRLRMRLSASKVAIFSTGLLAGALLAAGPLTWARARFGDGTAQAALPDPAATSAGSGSTVAGHPEAGAYPAQVLRVIDGDTVEVRVDLWLGHALTTRVRLAGIDAPEMNGRCPAETARARAARDRLAAEIDGRRVVLSAVRADRYHGRVVARLTLPDGQEAAAALLAEGLAVPWRGRRHVGWCRIAG